MLVLGLLISLFLISILGLISVRNNLIIVLVSLELMFLSSSMLFIFFSVLYGDFFGCLVFLIVLGVAGAEAVIGLGVLLVYYRYIGVVTPYTMRALKG